MKELQVGGLSAGLTSRQPQVDEDQERLQRAERDRPSSEGMGLADPGWVCGRPNLSPTFAGTNASCTASAATIGERSAHDAAGHAHPENCATGAATGIATEGAAKTAQRMGWKIPICAPDGIL